MITSTLAGFSVQVDELGNSVSIEPETSTELPLTIDSIMDSRIELSLDQQNRLVMQLNVPESSESITLFWERYGVSYLGGAKGGSAPVWLNERSLQGLVGKVRVALNGRL